MTLKSLEFEDLARGWKLNKTEFGDFNLLVGMSGVGKTSIVRAIQRVCEAGLSNRRLRPRCRWNADIATSSEIYNWRAETAESHKSASEDAVRFHSEVISTRAATLVERSSEAFVFNGVKLPKLTDSESAIVLLEDEPSIHPLRLALARVMFSNPLKQGLTADDRTTLPELEHKTKDSLDKLRDSFDDILLKAYVAASHHHDAFGRVRDHYCAIFPRVVDVTVGRWADLDPPRALIRDKTARRILRDVIILGIREEPDGRWITGADISSGMRRTFIHLAEIELSPPGTVIVVDEYENSMGVNCLPAVTDHFLRRRGELQFILTSHHPYVINNVPTEWWRVVTRTGGTVTVRDASEVPELNTRSRQDAFVRLINSSIYEAGIQ